MTNTERLIFEHGGQIDVEGDVIYLIMLFYKMIGEVIPEEIPALRGFRGMMAMKNQDPEVERFIQFVGSKKPLMGIDVLEYIIAEDENLTMESYLQKLESDQSLNLNRDFFTINLSTMEIHELTILPINESYFLDELIHNALESQG